MIDRENGQTPHLTDQTPDHGRTSDAEERTSPMGKKKTLREQLI